MDVAPKLPTMDDDALAKMRANAGRLMQTGTAAQQSAAAALMPLIKAELATRSAAKRSKTKVKPQITERATHAKPAASATEHCSQRKSSMKTHKFAVGQTVRFSPGATLSATLRGSYKIVRVLPAEANDYQYRVKSVLDGHERVVKESQLS